ncbi:NmrA family protein [Coprinopsis sp. MPI-PUGE-AT-0042]|nr:NmrA family protein [Coprinopsis sp. MPI-PUGE-AT-0042]
MTTLITGGGSNVGTHLGQLLRAAGRSAVFASRSGNRIPEGFSSVKLDWSDPSTFEGALSAGPFESVYLIGTPGNPEPAKEIVPFIEAALTKGVKKFVYLSGTGYFLKAGGLEEVPKYLKENGINHVVLKPTWFTENLTGYLIGARTKGQFETAVPTGRIPFVATEDIARAAFKAITEDNVKNDIIVDGPELLTYDELAAVTSEVLGKTIKHRPVSAEELRQIKAPWAHWLVDLELAGEVDRIEEKWFNLSVQEQEELGVEVFKGKTTVREWVEKHRTDFD